MTDKRNTVAIVSGASGGIGAEIARTLAADGIAILVHYAHNPERAAAVVARIEAAGGQAVARQADLSTASAGRILFDAAEDAFGQVDILVNNAGIMALAPVAKTDDASLEQHLAVNLAAPFRLMREAAERLADGGRVINLSSSVVGLYQPTYAAYAATKAGLEAVSRIFAKELGPRRITVNAVAPGPVATELFLEGKSKALIDGIKGANPFGRLGEPEDIARVVRFLTSPEGGWVNGQTIRTNGGIV